MLIIIGWDDRFNETFNSPGRKAYMKEDTTQLVSIVVPVYNEEKNIPLLYQKLLRVFRDIPGRFELIFSDDGSRDDSWPAITTLAAEDPKVRGVRLSRNFGHQYALMAGLEMASGDAVIMMDCDLQHPAELIPLLLKKWHEGFKVVKTQRRDHEEIGKFKQWSSMAYYRVFSFLSGVKMQAGLADFRLMDRQALQELLRFDEEGLFLRGLTEWIGFPSCVVPYQAGQRVHGRSRYNLRKMLSFAWKGVSSFSVMPLRIGILIGLVGSFFSLFGVIYAVWGKIWGQGTVPGWASTLMVISLLFFMLFVYLGILGEYVGRIIIEVRRRPRFIVCDIAGRSSHISDKTAFSSRETNAL